MNTLTYGSPEYIALKKEALELYGVVSTEKFDVKSAIRKRVDYLKNKLRSTGMHGYVLGISGGVDSSTAGKLAQLACEELRSEGYSAQFIAMRLPAGVQLDEADAQAALQFISPDRTLTVNVGESADNLKAQCVDEITKNDSNLLDPIKLDFHKGNLKARLRMCVQYFCGAVYGSLVLGTDHSTEGICGFFTKWADGSVDTLVLDGLNKTQVRLTAKELGAPELLWKKVATADLEELAPQKTDEEALGIDYTILDSFLEGNEVDKEIEYKIIKQYYITQHKRQPIPGCTTV